MSERHLGQTLGRYRVDELVGSGGFAWVYKAFDPELDVAVALKVLKPQFAGDETFEQRFRREASTAAKLRHPNIIKIFAVGREGEAVYFAMDYLPNGLADRLEVTSLLPEQVVARIGMDVASALGFAHREGVIHRDIKVDNILFDGHGNAVVADFGIARAVQGYSGQTGTNMVVGTPQYFAPEQARAKPLDGRADIYSLGVTMYRAATGQLPFIGDDWYEIARQHVEDPPPPPRSINPALSEEFERVILHCLEKHPDDRPATGELLAQELASFLPNGLERSAVHSRLSMAAPTIVVRETSGQSATPLRRRGSLALIGGAVAVAVLSVSIPLLARRGAPGSQRGTGDSLPPPAAVETVGRPVVGLPPGATAKDTAPSAASIRSWVRLNLRAPPGARVTVNGRQAQSGLIRVDTAAGGRYAVVGEVSAPEGCRAARDSQLVKIPSGETRPITITLRLDGCGTLSFASSPADARFTLVSLGSGNGIKQEGMLPLSSELVLPAGAYSRTLTRSGCATYYDTLQVERDNKTTASRVALIC